MNILLKRTKKILVRLLVDHGFMLVIIHSVVHWLFKFRIFRIPAIILWRLEIVIFSCHISPRCYLPLSTILPHPVGVVIGDGVLLSENVTIYQGVTLGLRNKKSNEYPIVGTDVVIYAGAIVIGAVTIADSSIIPANALIKG